MMDQGEASQFRDDLLEWSEENIRSFPWREAGTCPYQVLIAEIFLKQTRSQTVAKIYEEFINRYPTTGALQDATHNEIIEVIRPLGLYNYRADALKKIANTLANSPVPESEEGLMELPQVGRYVANATLCFGFNKPRPIVDSNIRRIYTRLFESVDPNDELWSLAEELLPDSDARRYNLALLDFGAGICTDSAPRCEDCFANGYCAYYDANTETG